MNDGYAAAEKLFDPNSPESKVNGKDVTQQVGNGGAQGLTKDRITELLDPTRTPDLPDGLRKTLTDMQKNFDEMALAKNIGITKIRLRTGTKSKRVKISNSRR